MCVTKFSIDIFETMYTHEIISENIGLTHTKDYNAYSLWKDVFLRNFLT